MERVRLDCQVCHTPFNRVYQLRSHMFSRAHQQKMTEVFQQDVFKGPGNFPSIVLIIPRFKHGLIQPILGLSMCFSRETTRFFYLCHVCEEKCTSERILNHLSSIDHCRNYFNYTNPNALSFCWIPSASRRDILKPSLQEIKEKGGGQLQLLDLPENLLKRLEARSYSEVMCTLSENDKLLKLLEAVKPKRMMIQTYQRDSNRKHPLLGMQHIVECICVGPTEKRYYLCTLCNLTLASHAIIKHVLSFDHIFCYFRAWHPSTLLAKESYKFYTNSFVSKMLSFAKQAERIHGAAHADMKQMSLEPAKFTSVNFSSYAAALKELESIRKENEESSLITSITPGNKLSLKEEGSVKKGKEESSSTTSITPGNKLALKEEESIRKENEESSSTTSITPGNKLELCTVLYKLRCQNCSMSCENMSQYCKHVSEGKHKQTKMLKKQGSNDLFNEEWKPSLGLNEYLNESFRQNQPLIGVPMVVTLISTQVQKEPIYLCFACQDCFPESLLRQHFDSRKHLIHTLLYQNPWRLTFAWENCLDMKLLRSLAREEEEERGPNQMMLKILDVPGRTFQSLISLSFIKVMEKLELFHSLLKRDVPKCETYSKLKQNGRFPLLGRQFLVMHNVCVRGHRPTEMRFLCLLCKRRLSEEECYTHVFSREHVATFINSFHPGSLDSSTDAETLLDFAEQAARIHSVSHVQFRNLDKPIREPCSYDTAIFVLTSPNNRNGKAKLKPPIIPKMRLVPRHKDHTRDNSQKNIRVMEGCEKMTSQKSTDTIETTLKNSSVEVGAEVTDTQCGEKGGNKETPTQSEEESEKRKEGFSKTGSEEISGSETCQAIKEEKIEVPTAREPSAETPESCQNSDKNDGTETGKEGSTSSKDVLPQKMKTSQEDTCPVEDIKQEMSSERQRLAVKDTSLVRYLAGFGVLPKEVSAADEGERGKPSHETAKDKASSNVNQQSDELWQYLKRKSREPVIGLSALIECNFEEHDPIYLCECCLLKIPEKDIIVHVTGVYHQRMYLLGKTLPQGIFPSKAVRSSAVLFEKENGYGEAQVLDLDAEIYKKISKQISGKAALQIVKALQDEQCSGNEPPITSAPSGVQPVDTSVTLNAQQEVCFLQDNHQEVMMEIDSEDSEAQPSTVTTAMSVMTEATSNTPKAPPETNDVKMTHIRVSDTNTCPTVSRSGEDKAEIIPSTTVGPFKIAPTSIIERRSETAAASDSTVTTSTTSVMATVTFTDKSSSSTPDTTKSTAPIAKRTTATSSCTTATTKLRETATTSSATISSTTSTPKFAPLSKPLENRTGAKVKATSYEAAASSNTESTVVREAARAAPASKKENVSKDSVNASKTQVTSQRMATSVATAKTTESIVECENTEASGKTAVVKNSGSTADVAPNIHKSKVPAAPHLTMPKNAPTEPSHNSTSKKRTSESDLEVGLNHLIKVSCEGNRQVYCSLCSVRLQSSRHTVSTTHQNNYVTMKFPGWVAEPSELLQKVAQLAEDERDVGTIQLVKVKPDMYRELAALPEDQAVQKLKTMKLKEVRVLSSSTTNAAEILRVPSASPCEPSSPDDGIYIPQNNQSEQKNRRQLVQMPENESSSKEETRSVKTSEPEAIAPIPDQPLLVLNKKGAIANPSIQDAGIANKMEKPQACAPPLVTDKREKQQRERSHPASQDTQKVVEGSQKTSPVTFFNQELLSSAAAVNTEQQNQPAPSQKTEDLSKHPQALPMISIGESTEGCSNLSRFLMVKKLDREPIIGLGFVWECREQSATGQSRSSFFLCESCMETLSLNDICQHMVSSQHQYNFILKQHCGFLYFWENNRLKLFRWDILKGIAMRLANRERYNKMDAQIILLGPGLYEDVRTAPFSEALKVVQNIKKKKFCRLISSPQQKDQRPEDQQSPEESLPMEMQPAQALETDQQSNNGARQKAEKHHLEETVGDLDGVKQRRASSPLDVTSVPSKAGCVVSPFSGVGTCLSPQEQPVPSPPVSQHQRPIPELHVKQAEVHSEAPSSSIISSETSQTLSAAPKDECCPTRKRPVAKCDETLVRSCANNPQLEDPLPAKCKRTCSELQPISQPSPETASESTSVNPDAASTIVFPTDKDTGLGSDELERKRLAELVALVREKQSQRNMSHCTSAPDDHHTTTSGANNSSKSAVSTLLPSASTDPCNQRSIDAQTKFGNASQSSPIYNVITNDNPGKIPQPQDNTETDSTGVRQLPINRIITVRPDRSNQQFMGSYNEQDPTEVNGGNQVTHSFSTVATVSPSDPSGRYSQCSQMAYVTNVQSGFFSSEAVGSYTAPDNPPVHTGSSYQCKGYTTGGLYPSQIYQAQAANFTLQSFGNSLATPALPGVRLGMLQLQQQQYSSWTRASLAAGDGSVTNEAAHGSAVPFQTQASNSQTLIDLNGYSGNKITSTQNITTQNNPEVYHNPTGIYSPAATHPATIFTSGHRGSYSQKNANESTPP